MTLTELSEYPALENETVVKVKVGDDIFQGKIVGQGAACPNPLYLVECTDGFIPSDIYPYKTGVFPLSEMIIEQQETACIFGNATLLRKVINKDNN